MDSKLIKQYQITENYQVFTLTEYSLLNLDKTILNDFIKSESFIKNHLTIFNKDSISIEKFKELNWIQLFDLFDKFSEEDDWAEDKNDFIILLSKLKLKLEVYVNNKFYLISKDWFEDDSKYLDETFSWIYIYYFIIITIDYTNNCVIVCDFFYD